MRLFFIHRLTVVKKGLISSSDVTTPLLIIQISIMVCQPGGQPKCLLLTHYAGQPSCGLNLVPFGTEEQHFSVLWHLFLNPFLSVSSLDHLYSLFSFLGLVLYTLPSLLSTLANRLLPELGRADEV